MQSEYSSVRQGHHKWRLKNLSQQRSEKLLAIGTSDFYNVDDLLKRLEIKRSIQIFAGIKSLWDTINPFKLR
jgi:hypothetical protein